MSKMRKYCDNLILLKCILAIAILLISNSHLYGQGLNEKALKNALKCTTYTLLENLKRFDTTSILSMYDTSFITISKSSIRKYTTEIIYDNCILLNKIMKKNNLSAPLNFTFTKESRNDANLVIVPLMKTPDSLLDLKQCNLVVEFYPTRFINKSENKIIGFYLEKIAIKRQENYKIKLPPPIH